MLDQPSFADLDYQHKRHKTRREQFLERLGAWVPGCPVQAGSADPSPLSQGWEGAPALSPVGDAAGACGTDLPQPE